MNKAKIRGALDAALKRFPVAIDESIAPEKRFEAVESIRIYVKHARTALDDGVEGGQETMCECGKNLANPPHDCPFRYEFAEKGDPGNDEYCTCCDGCIYECAMDI